MKNIFNAKDREFLEEIYYNFKVKYNEINYNNLKEWYGLHILAERSKNELLEENIKRLESHIQEIEPFKKISFQLDQEILKQNKLIIEKDKLIEEMRDQILLDNSFKKAEILINDLKGK